LESELQYCNLFPNGSTTKEIGLRKTLIFYFNWLPWQRLLTDRKKLNEVDKPFHPSTTPEILAKMIGPLDSEKQPVESRPLKNMKIKKKHWQNI